MYSLEPSYLATVNGSVSASLPSSSKRYMLPASLNTSTQNITSISKKSFIPFVQERDHLGRLLKDGVEDLNTTKTKSVPLKLSLLSPIEMKRIYETGSNRGEKLPSIFQNFNKNSVKSLYKMVENSFDNSTDEVKLTERNEIDRDKLTEHLFKIKVEPNKELQVDPPTTRHFKSSSHQASKANLKTEAENSRRSDILSQAEIKEPLKKTKSMARLSNLDAAHFRNISIVDSAYTGKSMETMIKDMISENDTTLKEDCSLYNPTVFRYDPNYMAQNKDVSMMMDKNIEKKKKHQHLNRLTLPENLAHRVPPLGLYQPQSKSVRHRSKHALILPEHETRINLEKLRQIKLDELQRAKLQQMADLMKQKQEEDNMKDDAYYKNLFKEMLQEINQRARRSNKNAPVQKIKKFDYIMLDKFSHFPAEFEIKMNEMRTKMRVVKEKIASQRDNKNE